MNYAWREVADFRSARSIPKGAAQLWLLPLDDPSWPIGTLTVPLSQGERDRAARFHFDRDRRHFIAAHGLLRMLLGAALDLAPAAVPITQERGEKPFLINAVGLDFNLSHSGGWALVGLSAADIGVDVEKVRPLTDRIEIGRRYFAASEAAAMAALPAAEREDGFFACWTRKEAYVKALGLGLAAPLDGFEVAVDPRVPAAIQAIGGDQAAAGLWSLWGGRPMAGLWAAAAVRRPSMEFQLFRLAPVSACDGPPPLR
jgi:4'-phosphopantetheinyl transferase